MLAIIPVYEKTKRICDVSILPKRARLTRETVELISGKTIGKSTTGSSISLDLD